MVGKDKVGVKQVSKIKAAKGESSKTGVKEDIEHLMQQKEEVETLLSSLEDAYNEAAIMEEDYQHVRKKNEEKLAEINRKINKLRAKGVKEEAKPAHVTPPAAAYMERPVRVVREVVKEVVKPPKKPAEKPKVAGEDKSLRKLMDDVEARITGKIKEVVSAAKVEESGKEVKEVATKLDKFEIDVEKLKALVEAVKEGRKILDEKMQRVTEGMAELRSIVYQREVSLKDQEVKFNKLLDSVSQVDPEKIVMEMKKRDREISNQGMKIERTGRIIDALNETISRMKNVMVNIGSLENVIKVSKTVTENLQTMESLKGNIEKSADRVQSIYVELSERMEEFLLYRTKQDRMEDLVNELMRSVDDMNTKLSRFVTRDDLEAFRQSFRPSGEAKADVIDDLQIQKEEINMLMKTLEDEYKGKRMSKEEFENTKKANLEKLNEIERRIKGEKERQAAAPAIPEAPEGETMAKPSEGKRKVAPPKPAATKKKGSEALLKDLEDTYKKGFISKEAYERTKKMILSGKG